MKIKKYRFQSFENIYVDEMIGTLIKGQIVLILVPSYKISYEDFNVNYLKTDETVKMNSYRNLNDKVNYFISHSFINIFFSKLMNTTIEKLRYEVAEDKKPYIKNEYEQPRQRNPTGPVHAFPFRVPPHGAPPSRRRYPGPRRSRRPPHGSPPRP